MFTSPHNDESYYPVNKHCNFNEHKTSSAITRL